MVFKTWFKAGSRGAETEGADLTIDDLMMLERYEEAVGLLRGKLKINPDDLHSHLKLAEVYTRMQRGADAVEEFVFVADEYARDGFYDKGIALLTKASRLNPLQETLSLKIEALQQAKRLEIKRQAALDGVREGSQGGSAAVELQGIWPDLARGSLVQRLAADQLRRLFAVLELERWTAGSLLAEEGELGDRLWILAGGVVEARVELEGSGSAGLRSFAAGDILGETVLFERRPWPASHRVVEDVLLLTLTRAGLEKALAGNPDPRGLLDALRWQGLDRQVAEAVLKLRARS